MIAVQVKLTSQVCDGVLNRAYRASSRDVLHQNFESYKPEVQELICVADRLGSLMQYETPGFLPNKRIHRGNWRLSGNGVGHTIITMLTEQKCVLAVSSERPLLLQPWPFALAFVQISGPYHRSGS